MGLAGKESDPNAGDSKWKDLRQEALLREDKQPAESPVQWQQNESAVDERLRVAAAADCVAVTEDSGFYSKVGSR